MLTVQKTKSGYTATVHDGAGKLLYSVPNPVSKADLQSKLEQAGCHPTDIHDEFFRVDGVKSAELRKLLLEYEQKVDELVESGVYPLSDFPKGSSRQNTED